MWKAVFYENTIDFIGEKEEGKGIEAERAGREVASDRGFSFITATETICGGKGERSFCRPVVPGLSASFTSTY